MSDILPIDREKLVDDVKLEPIIEKDEDLSGNDSDNDSASEAEETTPKVLTDDDIFEKPKKHASKLKMKIEEEPKPKKKKRVMSEQQLDNLKRAREKSMAKRKELKEARSMEAALKKDKRSKARDDKIAKKEEQDELILMKARLQEEATAKGHWDEDRLTSLMEKTLDSYMNKRKKERSIPKTTIPAPMQNPNVPAHQQFLDPKYYNPIPQQEQQAYFNHHYSQNKAPHHAKAAKGDSMNNLFGFSNQY